MESAYEIDYSTDDDFRTTTLTFSPDQLAMDVTFRGVSVRVETFCGRSVPMGATSDGLNYPFNYEFIIRPDQRQSLDWFADMAQVLRELFTFLIGSAVYILDLGGWHGDKDDAVRIHVNMPVQVPRAIKLDANDFSTHHRDCRGFVPSLAASWFEKLDDLKIATSAYAELLASDGLSPASILVRIAQTLEHLHGYLWAEETRYVSKVTMKRFIQWLQRNFPASISDVAPSEMEKLTGKREVLLNRIGALNQLSFRSRLERIFGQIPNATISYLLEGRLRRADSVSVDDFLEKLEATRHYWTHFDEEQRALSFTDDEIETATLSCWGVLTYTLARALGLDDSQSDDMARNARTAVFLVGSYPKPG
jgi:hypothetical protein